MGSIADNIQRVRRAIKSASGKTGRNPDEVRLVAIAKGFAAACVSQAVAAGIRDIGENYLQEALPKQEALKDLPVSWHFTGHLQRNKALAVSRHFQLIQGVDSWPLAEALNETGARRGKPVRILLQLKAGPEAAHGFPREELLAGRGKLLFFAGLEIAGIMTLGCASENSEQARSFFGTARDVFEELKQIFPPTFRELSMGMSGDFEVAIEEGATMVRIGRAIFGERPKGERAWG